MQPKAHAVRMQIPVLAVVRESVMSRKKHVNLFQHPFKPVTKAFKNIILCFPITVGNY